MQKKRSAEDGFRLIKSGSIRRSLGRNLNTIEPPRGFSIIDVTLQFYNGKAADINHLFKMSIFS